MHRYSDYDEFAWVYNRHWGSRSLRFLPLLETLLLNSLPPQCHVLDLCCGTGQLAQALMGRGYHVTGLDASPEMLRFAERNAPGVQFLAADARAFRSDQRFDAVVSLFDSLNHLMSLEELQSAFRGVHGVLRSNSRFLFDLNMESGYQARWRGSFGIVEADHACVLRAGYDSESRVGRYDITLFRAAENQRWLRSDLTLTQRCYTEAEVRRWKPQHSARSPATMRRRNSAKSEEASSFAGRSDRGI